MSDLAFASSSSSPYYECIAVSKTSDPVSGGWYLYAIRADDASHPWLPDYPKMGIWPDGLYMSANMFLMSNSTFQEVRAWAFNRAQMELGATVNYLIWDLGSTTYFSLLPSNLRGALPPTGTPNYFVAQDTGFYRFDIFKSHVDWVTPSNSTFNGPTTVSQTSYTTPGVVVPQPGTSTLLDTLGDRLMMQAQYRNISGVESLWVVHTVCPSGGCGTTRLQWAQINVNGGTINTTPIQQQIYGDASLYRWMPSLAVDGAGNMAIGFSIGNGTAPNYPSLAWAGRLSTDTAGTLGQGEATFFAGTGSQTGTTRWGDYSAMTVDPSDDCTFWYTNEYYAAGDTANWQTRIGAFKFPSCTASTLEPIGIWDGGGGDNNWATANNWTRNTVPTSNDNTYFNATSAKNATINGSYTFNSLNVTSGYSGIITQGAGNVTVSGSYAQAGGTFSGGSGNMTVGGDFSLTSGAFTAPSGSLSVAGNFSNSGAFNHNSGTVTFNGTTTMSGSSTTSLNNVTINSGKSLTAPSGNVNVAGNWTNNGTFTPGSGTVTFNRSGSQTVTTNSTSTYNKTESPALSIPDNSCPTYTESTLTVADSLTISDLNITINIAHAWDADLDIYLRGPDNTEVELSTDNGGSGSNYTNTTFDDEASTSITVGSAPFNGSYKAEGSLNSFDGKSTSGSWKLRVCDDAYLIMGSISSWSLQITSSDFNNLTVNSGSTTTTPSGNLSLTGNLQVNAGGTLDVGANAITGVEGTVTNNGTLKQTRTVNNATVAFLNIKNIAATTDKYFGVQIQTTNNLGSTTVSVSGNQVCSQANGYPVKRCFVVNPTNTANSNITFYYRQAELQTGQNANALKAWKYNGSAWSQAGTSTTASACSGGAINFWRAGEHCLLYDPPGFGHKASSGPFSGETSPGRHPGGLQLTQRGDAVLLTWDGQRNGEPQLQPVSRHVGCKGPIGETSRTLIHRSRRTAAASSTTWEDRAADRGRPTSTGWRMWTSTGRRHRHGGQRGLRRRAVAVLDVEAGANLPLALPLIGAGC
ncbi:proprotein convertase P-domain-containing protein [Candidatus Amarolinea aalborgensis]|uniref:proprotein convertase P-domain-containing protein n=1 Tax=Candidatus Amarolinea aalborgensis TaxID=2249329 RepID=UPI003BF97B47